MQRRAIVRLQVGEESGHIAATHQARIGAIEFETRDQHRHLGVTRGEQGTSQLTARLVVEPIQQCRRFLFPHRRVVYAAHRLIINHLSLHPSCAPSAASWCA
jgi:hypothetical protein